MIEPMSVEEIKGFLSQYDVLQRNSLWYQTGRIILSWIHAEARARELNHWYLVFSHQRRKAPKDRDSWKGEDYIAAVKREVGWEDGSDGASR